MRPDAVLDSLSPPKWGEISPKHSRIEPLNLCSREAVAQTALSAVSPTGSRQPHFWHARTRKAYDVLLFGASPELGAWNLEL